MSYGFQNQPQGGVIHAQPQSSTNTIIVQQPGHFSQAPRDWSSSLFSCCEDIPICLCGFFLSPCLSMKVAQDMDEFVCLPCCVPAADLILRVKMRTQEHIPGSICNDCMIVWCCSCCALCQLAREVKFVKNKTNYAASTVRM
ncbi:unnamed protein product [Lymnaea stagnalis]|uniref:Uncharacterized protein n=1 Tax=Lymnaea stagnalis TaxID=6523 RepID=A0AAV2H3U7_LYMST